MDDKKTTVNPYLTFAGNCREAMEFYKQALDAGLELMTFADAPMDVPPEAKNNILHATITFGDAVIMAADNMPGQTGGFGAGNAIYIASPSTEEGERFFNNLSQGGQVTMPFAKMFWDAMFGMCTDKFGVSWMVNVQLNSEQE